MLLLTADDRRNLRADELVGRVDCGGGCGILFDCTSELIPNDVFIRRDVLDCSDDIELGNESILEDLTARWFHDVIFETWTVSPGCCFFKFGALSVSDCWLSDSDLRLKGNAALWIDTGEIKLLLFGISYKPSNILRFIVRTLRRNERFNSLFLSS